MRNDLTLRPNRTTSLSFGMVLILVSFGTQLLSRGRDGFDKGLFQGMTVALAIIGTYLIGSALWHKDKQEPAKDSDRGLPGGLPGDHADGPDQTGDDLWLPSRDNH